MVCSCAHLGLNRAASAIPRALATNRYQAHRVLYLQYSTNVGDNQLSFAELSESLKDISRDVSPLQADEDEFSIEFRERLRTLPQGDDGGLPQVAVDISTFSSRLLMRCMKVLLESDVRLRLLYSEASIYHPTQDEYTEGKADYIRDETLGLDKGVGSVEAAAEYPGEQMDGLPDRLIVIPSFNAARTRAVVSEVDHTFQLEPDGKVYWLLGKPHLPEDEWRFEAMREVHRLPKNSAVHPLYPTETFDYKDTVSRLEMIYEAIWEWNSITLAPLGAKMQTLGAAIFCYLHPDVRVITTIPKEYNASHYSEGCKNMWEIGFGDTRELRAKLDSVGSLQVLD